MKKVLLILMVAVLATASQAALLSWSDTAPTVDEADIANFIGVSADADNVNYGGDDGTYVANNQPAVAQMFTTGSNPLGYQLTGITLQHVLYDTDITWWSVDGGWAGYGAFEVKVGTKNGTISFTALTTEWADPVVTGIPALDATGNQSGQGTAAYATFTLDTPIILSANTIYGFSVWSNNPFFETNGDGTTSDNYTGGEAFGVWGSDVYDYTGDHVFHVDLAEVPEPATMLLLGLGSLVALKRDK